LPSIYLAAMPTKTASQNYSASFHERFLPQHPPRYRSHFKSTLSKDGKTTSCPTPLSASVWSQSLLWRCHKTFHRRTQRRPSPNRRVNETRVDNTLTLSMKLSTSSRSAWREILASVVWYTRRIRPGDQTTTAIDGTSCCGVSWPPSSIRKATSRRATPSDLSGLPGEYGDVQHWQTLTIFMHCCCRAGSWTSSVGAETLRIALGAVVL